MTITVEIPDPKKLTEVEIYLNDEDIQYLITDLERLRAGKIDHTHYMSSDWGGDELGTTARRSSSQILHHLRIVRVKKD